MSANVTPYAVVAVSRFDESALSCQVYALAIMNINPGEELLTKLAAEATKKIAGFIAQNLSNTIWCALRFLCVLVCYPVISLASWLSFAWQMLTGTLLCRRAFSTLGAPSSSAGRNLVMMPAACKL